MNNKITIQIPHSLAEAVISQRTLVNKYETNKIIRAIDTWLCLKSTTTSSIIQHYHKQLPALLQTCKISKASFLNRLHYLQSQKLITWDMRNRSITICSYKKLADHFNYIHTSLIPKIYDVTDNKRIFDHISAVEWQCNQDLQRKALHNHLDKNPEIKSAQIEIMCRGGADRKRLLDDKIYYQQTLWHFQQQSFKTCPPGSETYQILHAFHADVNRSTHKALKRSRNYKSASSVSYEKKRMVNTGIIKVEKIKVLSRVRARKNKEYRVRWLEHKKQTIWFIPDQVTIIPSAEPALVVIQTVKK